MSRIIIATGLDERVIEYFCIMRCRNDSPDKQVAILQQCMAWLMAVKGKSNVTIGNVYKKKICSAHFVSGKWFLVSTSCN